MSDPTKNTTGNLNVEKVPLDLIARAKGLAYRKSLTLRDLVIEGLRREVERREATK